MEWVKVGHHTPPQSDKSPLWSVPGPPEALPLLKWTKSAKVGGCKPTGSKGNGFFARCSGRQTTEMRVKTALWSVGKTACQKSTVVVHLSMRGHTPPLPSSKEPSAKGVEKHRPIPPRPVFQPSPAEERLAQLQAAADQSAPVRAAAQLSALAERRLEIRPLAPQPAGVAQKGTAAGLTIQCVGGAKFGLRASANKADAEIAAGLNILRGVWAAYKHDVKTAKQKAIHDFAQGASAFHRPQRARNPPSTTSSVPVI